MSKMVFISAPYTHPDPIENTRIVCEVWHKLRKCGFIPFAPHLSMLLQFHKPMDIQFWYDYDIEVMKRCDIVLRLQGESVGADNEVRIATNIGVPVFTSVDELVEFTNNNRANS